MGEAYSKLHVALKYYGRVENGKIVKYGAHIPFNFEMMSNTWMGTGSYGFIESINNWVLNLPKGKAIHPNWVVGIEIFFQFFSKFFYFLTGDSSTNCTKCIFFLAW